MKSMLPVVVPLQQETIMTENRAETNTLIKKVEARLDFLNTILTFIPRLVKEHGKQTHYEIKSYHTEATYELNGFQGFSFYTHGVFTMYGGENLKVWYHPGGDKPKEPVLDVDWWELNDPQIRRFEERKEWQTKLLRMARNKEHTLRQLYQKRIREETAKKRKAKAEAQVEAAKLTRRKLEAELPKRAKSLGLR